MSNQNSTIKYSAIASAVALACAASVSHAATLADASTQVLFSLQGNQSAATTADFVPGSPVSFLLGTAYAVNDTLVFTLAGASFRTGGALPTAVTCHKTGSNNNSTVVLSFLNKTSSQLTLRVTEGTGLDNMTGASCAFPVSNLSMVQSSALTIGTSSIGLTLQSFVGGNTSQPFDTAIATAARAAIGGVGNQYSAAVRSVAGAFAGTIDVARDRRSWVEGTSRVLGLSFTSVADNVQSNAVPRAATSVSVSIYGAAGSQMFSFLDDDGDGCSSSDLTSGAGRASVSSGSLTISQDCGTLTFSQAAFVGGDIAASLSEERVITLSKQTASTGLQIADGSFTVAPVFTASTATQTITAFSGGSFGLNGTVVTVPYMPYGLSGTQEISSVYSLANTSGTSGTVTAVARNQAGVLCSLGSVGVAAARSVTNLSQAINQGIAACYAGSSTAPASAFPAGTRVFVTLTANTPAANTILNTTYNVGGNSRVNVVNTSTRVTNN